MPISRAELKSVKSLQTRKGRKENRQFAVEGVRTLEEALRHRARPSRLFYAEAVLSERGMALIGKFAAIDIETVSVAAGDLDRMSGAVTSPGILGVFALPIMNQAELWQPHMRNVLMCEDLSDPGNLGTLCRGALAFGVEMVLLCGQCAEPYSPKVVRSSVGAVFGIPIAVASTTMALEFFKGKDFVVAAADANSGRSATEVFEKIADRPMILALGSEAKGLSAELAAGADFRVQIKHEPSVDSLNTAVAGSILMNECYERRLRR